MLLTNNAVILRMLPLPRIPSIPMRVAPSQKWCLPNIKWLKEKQWASWCQEAENSLLHNFLKLLHLKRHSCRNCSLYRLITEQHSKNEQETKISLSAGTHI